MCKCADLSYNELPWSIILRFNC